MAFTHTTYPDSGAFGARQASTAEFRFRWRARRYWAEGGAIIAPAPALVYLYIIFPGWGLAGVFSPAFARVGERMGLNTTTAEEAGSWLSIAVFGLCSLAAWHFLGGRVWIILIGILAA